MTHRVLRALVKVAPIALLMSCALAMAQTPAPDHKHKEPATSSVDATAAGKHDPAMHMHKSDIAHSGNDAAAAMEFKGEAAELRRMAAAHRNLAAQYKGRTPVKGPATFDSVAKHCEQLAKSYEDAAKAAEALASELGKK